MSEIPSLEQMLKLWSKKDLWNRIQEKNQRIEELKKKLENATKVNCVKCPHYHITVREENNTTIKSYDCKLGGSILTSGCPLKELKELKGE